MSDSILKLYHGSYCVVQTPDLSMCRPGKDFGVGFYLTTSREQAVRFTKTSIMKAQKDWRIGDSAIGFVSEFAFDPKETMLDMKEFPAADSEWLHCVASYRKKGLISSAPWDGFDFVIGKIANDRTNLVITGYLDGVYGEPGSGRADEIAISLLEPEKLKDQYCFRTQKALETLVYAGSERIIL